MIDNRTCRRVGLFALLAILLTIACPAQEPSLAGAGTVWVDACQGEPVQYAEMLDDLATADVIYLGERHTLDRHHALQAKIVADLARTGVSLVLGLEQMDSSQQAHLDRFNRGQIDFAQLATATDWAKRWNNYQQYCPILEIARKAKMPVVALNASSETIRQVVRSGGVERMPADARKRLPAEMQLQDPAYEKVLSMQMMVHAAATPGILRPMIEAQIARDETMAHNLVTFLQSEAGRGRKAVVLCGAGHVAFGLGIPQRVERLRPGTKSRIVVLSESGEVRLSPEEKAQARDIEISHEQWRAVNRPVADYLGVKPLPSKPDVKQ